MVPYEELVLVQQQDVVEMASAVELLLLRVLQCSWLVQSHTRH
jgi:hypothetical protein